MRFDLPTLYFLAIGTLLLSAVMTLWERHARPQYAGPQHAQPLRKSGLGILATGYAMLAGGCALAMGRTMFAAPLGASLANMILLGGYLLVFWGAAGLAGRKRGKIALAIWVFQALVWCFIGGRWQDIVWNYVSAFPIALASGLTAWELWANGRFVSCDRAASR
ncbi:hypothetical protein WBP06_23050 [Novosphingobium sp. BL-8H]|uniref:hypothetical protein n=1 Tax=Novosphingobium sp. BL-8H TaxID=3127640 RepID=UPI003756E1D2